MCFRYLDFLRKTYSLEFYFSFPCIFSVCFPLKNTITKSRVFSSTCVHLGVCVGAGVLDVCKCVCPCACLRVDVRFSLVLGRHACVRVDVRVNMRE